MSEIKLLRGILKGVDLSGNMKMKLSRYVAAYREDMAMVLALVKFLAYDMYVIYSCPIFSHSYLIFLLLLDF